MSDRPARFLAATERVVSAVGIVDWGTTFGHDHGGCIPISVFTAAFYEHAGISARPVEAGVRMTDPLNKRWAEIDSYTDERVLEAENKPGLGFLGHLVVHVPAYRVIVDLSLGTQASTVMLNLNVPDALIGNYDHTKGQTGFKTRVGHAGRGEATYRIYPRRDGWRHRRWPYDKLRLLARLAESGAPPFDGIETEIVFSDYGGHRAR